MAETLDVYMDGVLCGLLQQSGAGNLTFVYDENYRRQPDATPLSLSMPLAFAEHRKRVVLPYIDGLITDNPVARDAIAKRFGVSAGNPFVILAHTGSDVAGALQMVSHGMPSSDAVNDRNSFRVMTTAEVAAELRGVIEQYRDGRSASDISGGFSLAGAQPKTALLRTPEGQLARPIGATPTTHILKPVVGDFRRLDVVEQLTMRAAALLGLSVAVSELHSFDGVPTFVVERYDRRLVNGRWRRLHQEDLGQSLAVPPSKKYQRHDRGPGVGDVAQLFRGLPQPSDRADALWDFYRGLMFNTVVEGTDAHIKNYSVMLNASSVQLAPLYDLATYAPYRAAGQPVYSAMRIGREHRFDAIGQRQCLDAAATLKVERERAAAFLDELRDNVAGAFESARDELVQTDSGTREFANEVLAAVAALPLVR